MKNELLVKSEFHVAIAVKVADGICNILLLELPIAVFAKVLTYLPAVKVPETLTVDPLKRGIRLEINKPSHPLPLPLYGHLGLPQMLQQCSQLHLGLEAQSFLTLLKDIKMC